MFDEQAYLNAAQQGDLTAFNQLILRYQSMAYTIAFRIVQNQEDATDIVQTSLLNAFHKLNQLQGENFKSWLMRIVFNRSYDLLRSRKRRPTISWEEAFAQSDESSDPMADDSESPFAHVQRRELGETINEGLAALREEYRIVLVLSDIQGYSYEEIAEMMGCPLGTVKSNLSRARAKMRDYLLQRSDLLPVNYYQLLGTKSGKRPAPSAGIAQLLPGSV